MSGHAFLAGGHQEQRGEPLGQRYLGTLEYGANGHGKLLTARRFVALKQARTVRFAP